MSVKPQNNFSGSLECCLPPQFQLFGESVTISTAAGLLAFGIVPFLVGILSGKQKILGTSVMILVVALGTFGLMSERWLEFDRSTRPFDLEIFALLALYTAPAFLAGLFLPRILNNLRSRVSRS